jgi:hypothetical protein
VIGIDVETVGGKIGRSGEHLDRLIRRLLFLNENLGVSEALKSPTKYRARRNRLLVEKRLELVLKGDGAIRRLTDMRR